MFQRSVSIEHFDGDTLNVIHHEGLEINAFHYLNGIVTNIPVSVSSYFDGLERSELPALSDGFYIIYSSLATKVYMKGNLPRNIFIKDLSEDNPDSIEISRFSTEGTSIGILVAAKVHSNIYSVIIPTANTEIINIDELYVVCDISGDCSVYNVSTDYPRSSVQDNVLKADIISNNLSTRLVEKQPKFSLRKTTFRSE